MFQEQYMKNIAAVFGIAAIIALGSYAYSALEQARYSTRPPMTISVDGKGEVYAKPDIAEFNFSVNAKEKDVATAQSKSAESMNAILSFLKNKGVDEKDIKTTNYNITPWYEYSQAPCPMGSYCPPGEQKLMGYEVSQTIDVKVRKTETAGDLIAGIGGLGATNMSGLSFTIDDEETVKAEAREKAIADAEAKSVKLAHDLGVRIVRMTNYSENTGPVYYGLSGTVKAMAADVATPAPSPEIPTGQNLVTSNVTMSFEVR